MKNKRKIVFICIALVATLYLVILMWFLVDGKIPTGSGLTKSDWLGFFGGFLSFLGTTFLGIITLLQTKNINKQRLLSECRASVNIGKGNSVLIVYDVEYDSDNLETCVYLHENNKKAHRYITMQIPFAMDSKHMPDSVYVNYMIIETREYPEKRRKFQNWNDQFVPIFSIENNRFLIMFEVSENCDDFDFFDYMIKSSNNISLSIDMLFKIEKVITPAICTLLVNRVDDEDKITDGLIRFKDSYMG